MSAVIPRGKPGGPRPEEQPAGWGPGVPGGAPGPRATVDGRGVGSRRRNRQIAGRLRRRRPRREAGEPGPEQRGARRLRHRRERRRAGRGRLERDEVRRVVAGVHVREAPREARARRRIRGGRALPGEHLSRREHAVAERVEDRRLRCAARRCPVRSGSRSRAADRRRRPSVCPPAVASATTKIPSAGITPVSARVGPDGAVRAVDRLPA